MDPCKSLDEVEIIAALLRDVQNRHGFVFNTRALRLTTAKLRSRVEKEGRGFLTKTLPRLGKQFDNCLSSDTPLTAALHGFDTMDGSELPRFLGEFFSQVLDNSGAVLPNPCHKCVSVIRQLTYLFYKYELPYTDEQEQHVVSQFERTESDLEPICADLRKLREEFRLKDELAENSAGSTNNGCEYSFKTSYSQAVVARRAKDLLTRLFIDFDPMDIVPRHGPGAVATKQKLWEKYRFTNVSRNITRTYPYDAYFCASLGHVCDSMTDFASVGEEDLPARVVLVPKDSRGPRLISCEPVDYQWIQQGLGQAIVRLTERHPLTRDNVRFTDQEPNRFGALMGSLTGRYATLDLKEASDRVSLDLVRLLFPECVLTHLESCRSSSTELPDGRVIPLKKFAPMGSCLCFPILALTTWAILAAAAPDADTREGIYVYGDDVIVPTAYAANAIEQLESFGLLVNRGKSCTKGFFRESCGMDAFRGIDVTPVRLRTVWSSAPSPDVYTSWIAYANSFYDKQYYLTYDYIVSLLIKVYTKIPETSMHLACPSLRSVPAYALPTKRRFNKSLQKLEYRVLDVKSPLVTKEMDGWLMLLRYFTSGNSQVVPPHERKRRFTDVDIDPPSVFSVRQYTKRKASLLVRRWR